MTAQFGAHTLLGCGQFKTEEFAFYKNERTDELDAVLGDLKGIIADVESQIVRDLANRVLAVAAVRNLLVSEPTSRLVHAVHV